MMDDLIEFVKLIAKAPPKLPIALIGEAIYEYWFQSLATVSALGAVAALAYFLRRKPRIECHEFVVKPVPMPEPHKAPVEKPRTVNCKCTITPMLITEDENGFCEWYGGLVLTTGVNFSENEARKLYAVKMRVKVEL